jgi:threonine dehydratase
VTESPLDRLSLLAAEGLTPERLELAYAAVHRVMPPTPLVESPSLSRGLHRPVWLKLESVTPTRAFKVRGALAKVAELEAAGRMGRLVTASSGNHGLAVAYAGQRFGRPVTVFVPEGASPLKVAAIREQGAEVVVGGTVFELNGRALAEVDRIDGEWVHPFDDPAVIAGQASVGREIAEALPAVAQVVAPIGGGGLASGVAVGLAMYAPQARLVGVQMDGADAMLRSVAEGRVVTLERVATIADGLRPGTVSERTLRIVGGLAQTLLRLTDDALAPAMHTLLTRDRVLCELSGAAAVAALLGGAVPGGDGPVVAIVSGANVPEEDVLRALEAPLPEL